MRLPRRRFLQLAAGAAALPTFPQIASAQSYPARPVHIVAGVPAGLAPDILARLTGQWLSERLGQPIVIDNRPGAGTNIATEAVVRAAPDGYTLHVFGELFKMMTGVDLVHVPYRSNYMPDLLSGQVQLAFSSIPASIEFIRTDRLRALAVTPARRLHTLPDIPCRIRAGLRREQLVRHLCTKQHSHRDRRQAQQADQCRGRRSRIRHAPRHSR